MVRDQQNFIASFQPGKLDREAEREKDRRVQQDRERNAVALLCKAGTSVDPGYVSTILLTFCKKTKVPLEESFMNDKAKGWTCILRYQSSLRTEVASATRLKKQDARTHAAGQMVLALRRQLMTEPSSR